MKQGLAALVGLMMALFTPGRIVAGRFTQKSPGANRAGTGSGSRAVTIPAGRYANQPYVVEEYTTELRFEDDGTSIGTVSARLRIQSAAAAQKFAQLAFTYNAEAEDLAFEFVRVLKPDGRRVDADLNSVKKARAAVVQNAPAYGNYQQASLAVPELGPGDLLSYRIVKRVLHPGAPGEFWMQHRFLADAIVLRENLEIAVPKSRPIHLRSPRFPYVTDAASTDRVVFRWQHSNLTFQPEDQQAKGASEPLKPKPADVQMTTFPSWVDVSRWYGAVQRRQAEPSAEVRAKAIELTGARPTELEKIEALYDYVAKRIRTVAVTWGSAGYEPHSAREVLADQYGDDAGKNALLAAMLQAIGVDAQTALVSDAAPLDSALPSPAPFTRVLTAVATGGNPLIWIWLDPSSEVLPFRFVPASLRKKPCLLIAPDGNGKITETPTDPPFLSTQQVEIDGQISDLGKLTAHLHYQLRGDNEYVLRLAFQHTPEPQWKDLAQTILTLDGLHGEVLSVNPGDPTRTEQPFSLDIEYAQPNFLDWSSPQTRVALPLLTIGIPEAPKQATERVLELGSPLQVVAQLRLTLPQNFLAHAPVGLDVSRDYAEFKSSYRFEDHTLSAERSIRFTLPELPSSRSADYIAFSRAVSADQAQLLVVENSSAGPAAVPPEATAEELFEAGSAALASGNPRSSIALLERVVKLDPTYRGAWTQLGLSYMRAAEFDRAQAAFRKQLEIDPSEPQVHNYLGLVLRQQQKYDQAELAFRAQIELNPLDTVAHAALGAVYLSERKYAQAAPELDKAAALSPDQPELQVSLGEAWINLGQNEKALAAFETAVSLSPAAAVSNNVAYSLAAHKFELERALEYAQSAVSATAAKVEKVDLEHISAGEIEEELKLASYWDTLGLVYLEKGDLNSARRYIVPAWLLSRQGTIAYHLAQIDEKEGHRNQALKTYALALAVPDPSPEARARLTLLLGGNAKIPDLVGQARSALAGLDSFPAGESSRQTAEAEFSILLSPAIGRQGAARVVAARFLGGNQELRADGDRLRAINFGSVFPDGSSRKLARRGTLRCSAGSGGCVFTLLPLEPGGWGDKP